ncbi:MAG: hypothetical protein OEM85_11880 [Gammaproteobacteria bacterium]|nr:hypothetical protein [Gammaproteobacteria bacterium]MDH3410228.1 hypothetical protein [Gammaproteobacteria bacterium]
MNVAAIPQITVAAFEDGALDVAAFDHEAHVYVAWLYLNELPLLDAIDRFSAALKKLTTSLGVPGKYHETITWFFMMLIAERRQRTTSSDWFSFRRSNADLFDRKEKILNRYYSKDVLGSRQARQSFVLPNSLAE